MLFGATLSEQTRETLCTPLPSLLLFVTTKIPLRLLILMGSQGNLIINACQTQKHWHCHVISVTILRAQSSRTPGDLIFITANEGGKMCSNTHFCNDWVYHRLGLKAWINNRKEAIGKTTISCDYWFSLRVLVDVLIHRHEGTPGWMRLWDHVLWPCRTIVNGLVVCDGLDFRLCMKISLDKRFMFPSLQSQWNQVKTCCIIVGHRVSFRFRPTSAVCVDCGNRDSLRLWEWCEHHLQETACSSNSLKVM